MKQLSLSVDCCPYCDSRNIKAYHKEGKAVNYRCGSCFQSYWVFNAKKANIYRETFKSYNL